LFHFLTDQSCIADQKTVEDKIEARELARIIEAFLDTLTAKERVIFMRRFVYTFLRVPAAVHNVVRKVVTDFSVFHVQFPYALFGTTPIPCCPTL